MANKALLIGISEYKHGLEQLPSAVDDVDIVRRVLLSSEAGRFAEEDIKVLTNPNLQMMEEEIENLFLYPQSDDLIFFFYSGHCIQDSGGKLYLSSSTTRRSYTGDLIRSSALAAGILHESMNRSSSKRQIVILDSYFRDIHGEIPESKNVVNASMQQSLVARGAAAVADSLPKPYLFAPDASELLNYHRYLVEGIEKIIVDKDEDAYFYIDDLHEYVTKKLQENSPSITPKFSPIELGNHKILQGKLPPDVGKSKDERESHPVKQQLIAAEEIGESEPSSKELSPTSLLKKLPAKIKTQSFEFEFATIAYVRSRFLGMGKTCELQKKKGTAKFFTLDLGEDVVKEMVAIPGGQFMIGSPAWELERLENEGPQQIVIVEPFFMSKFTVTQAQWARVAYFPKIKIDLDPDPSYFKGLDRPVEKVSWNDVQEFCARLSIHTKMNMRLPTEFEWEYACRARTTTPFYFGETISINLANYRGTDWADEDIEYKGSYAGGPKGKYRQQTTNVGIFPANPFGLYDMHGNVWEWCQDDWRENYDITLPDSTANIEFSETKRKVLRGGSWHSFPDSCRSASRLRGIPDSNPYHIGLRVVCDGVTE